MGVGLVGSIAHIGQYHSLTNQADKAGASAGVYQAIKVAANRTGVDFSYLMAKASQESSFDPNAKAATSSATGLYQFTKQTWLSMIKNHGADYGLGGYADKITVDAQGVAHVADKAARQEILALRHDPQVSAEMAGELDKDNLASLQDNVGGKLGGTELYLAHFLGAGGASDFLKTMRSNPSAKAADVLPTAAAANPSVFYNANGEPRSLKQIYQHFAQKFDGASTTSMVAVVTPRASVSGGDVPVRMAAVAASYPTPSATVVKPTATSLFATMVLAQADRNSAVLSSLLDETKNRATSQDDSAST